MGEVSDADREAVKFWGDPLRALLMEAPPDSDLFDEVRLSLSRRSSPREHPYLAAADVQSVVVELGLTVGQFARVVGVPPAYAYGLVNGWLRLSPKGLVEVAWWLDVPLGVFFHDADFRERWRVRRYRAFERSRTVVRHVQ
jgi:hypothetical protein